MVTGAASGIGRELAHELAGEGAWLALAARDQERLEKVKSECETRGGRAITVRTDVGQQAQCAALIEETGRQFGRIDVLVNNAGITMWARFEDIQDLGMIERIMRINFFGSVSCTYYALPYLKQAKG
ncbi:MAG: SDR family NAD(P)-dependent oxidoreductase [Desulfomonilaceae bacterium]